MSRKRFLEKERLTQLNEDASTLQFGDEFETAQTLMVSGVYHTLQDISQSEEAKDIQGQAILTPAFQTALNYSELFGHWKNVHVLNDVMQ